MLANLLKFRIPKPPFQTLNKKNPTTKSKCRRSHDTITDPPMITWMRDVNMDDLVILSSNIDDLRGEAPRCANNKSRGGALNYKMNPFA